ncbi:MAG: peptidoglycan-binding protein [Epulopiscium sp. Nele67-Bin005]|nr:MAG: peptidoglycan-binding protein [Epulopiscium sp. Nele67-Bin005]
MNNPYAYKRDNTLATGFLVVEVRTDPAFGPSIPVRGVNIIVSRTINSQTQIIEEAITDEAGQTVTFELEAPPEVLSQEEFNEQRPYATYTIEATSNDYVSVVVSGTQIFANVKSIQSINLVPKEELSTSENIHTDVIENINIEPSTLYGDYPPKIPEREIKDVAGTGFIVLSEVVVPEFVIVHAGSPNVNNAPNYTVRYKDYIKNVASSEIYPTWPRECIKANVIAINSFTLNRVYTEWYRNQGKWFTITNSTAFDHAFVYGRDIFDSISQIVDEIFDIYVKRPGVLQPLLTQYCDGRYSSCPNWMTQWGSKALADDGLSAEQILKFYYGNDIQILSAPTVQGIPESFNGVTLKVGSSGAAVRTIQQQLNRIAQVYSNIPKVASDGVYGQSTADAVRAFQKTFHLTQDGMVGKSTWYKISEIYVAITKIAALI